MLRDEGLREMTGRDIIKNRTAKNAGWLIAGGILNKLLVFAAGILTTRYLGPANYGLIDYAGAYITFFAAVCTLGINSVIIKNFVDHPDEEGKTLGTAMLLRAVSAFAAAAVIVFIVSIIDHGERLTITVVALCCASLFFQVFGTFSYWFQSKLKSKYYAIASLSAYALVLIYKLVMLSLGKDVRWFAAAGSIEFAALGAILAAAYFMNGGQKLSVSRHKAVELLKSSSGFIIAGIMISVYASTDKMMLKQMMDEESVGFYSLATVISGAGSFVLSAVINSMHPGIVKAKKADCARYERKNRQLYAIVFYASIAMSLFVCIFARPIIKVIYGEEYLPAVVPLRIVVWYTAFSYLGGAREPWVISENKQKYLKYLYLISALVNVGLNFALIPRLGPAGAAIASLVTQISTTFIVPAFMPALRPNAKLMLDAVLLKGVFERPDKSKAASPADEGGEA